MAEGFSFMSFGAIAGCGRATLYEWVERYPEFKKAKKAADSLSLLYYEKLLKRKHEGDKDIDTACVLFPLKTRWHEIYGDKTKHQITVTKSVEQLVFEAKKEDLQIEDKTIEIVEYKEVKPKEKKNGNKRTKKTSK